ncbi:MAG: metalloregulator ArsR/SmtB family transcription factor [Actinomycetota bacterium]|nr:metalloregulator ArsR/SmtB family transcription factor [Actinomycetota bacterium]
MRDRAAKEALFDAFAMIGKALANGRRAEIVDVLANGARSVESLATEIGQSVANTSQHLQTLKNAGLVSSRREGTRVFYNLASPEVASFWRAMQEVAVRSRGEVERLAEDYLGPLDTAAVTKEELWRRLEKGARVVVLDVRPEDEYRAGHIPKARSIPLAELKKRLDEVPRTSEIVAYCRGPFCALAPEAVRLLRARGFKARRLEDGIPEWVAAGLPIDAA